MDTTEKLRRMAFTPMRTPLPRGTKEILDRASAETEAVDGDKVVHYVWSGGERKALLVHGWAGNAGHVAVLAEALVAQGFTVVALDLPGHGESEGKESSVIHFARAIEAANVRYGPFHAVAAHSMGAPAVTYGMSRGLAPQKVVFFNPISSYTTLWRRSGELLQASPEAIALVRARAEDWLGVVFDDIEPLVAAPGFAGGLLVVHDAHDPESPLPDSRALVDAWPEAELVEVENLGHTRVLRDEGIVRRVVAFMTEAEDASGR
ncbi:alpha/beta hydrolase [Streptomyces sp. CA-294286]|uniref:alpha/beta hydrolase n=1 Tax=Streptomyces sp. CA-294286 TaxID=3240070 RepID=UPI003D929E68